MELLLEDGNKIAFYAVWRDNPNDPEFIVYVAVDPSMLLSEDGSLIDRADVYLQGRVEN